MSCTGRLGLVRSTRNYQLIILFKGIIGMKQLTVFEMESIAGGTFDLLMQHRQLRKRLVERSLVPLVWV